MNSQPREPLSQTEPSTLDVHSIFFTIQGEGPFTGHPAVFVRLAGCNLQCMNCDTDYTSGRHCMTVNAITDEVVKHRATLVVISGGEPFRQNISLLVRQLGVMGYTVQIETNGTVCPPWIEDTQAHIVICPKTTSIAIKWSRLPEKRVSFKYVMNANNVGHDGLPTSVLGIPITPFRSWCKDSRIYIQPEDVGDLYQNDLNVQACVKSCMKNGYVLCLQVHKIVRLP
jgi:7-carboxy-7-deazaguanine synthase